MAPRRPGVKENQNCDEEQEKVEGIYAEPGPVAPRARNRGERIPPLYANIDLLKPATTTGVKSDQPTKEAKVNQSFTQMLSSYKLRRTLWEGWLEYQDIEGRRPPLFVNQRTQEKRLKPPRRLTIGSTTEETETSTGNSLTRMTSAATQTTLSYSTPLERRKIGGRPGEATSLTSDESDDESAAIKEMKNVKDIVRKWNESSMRTRRVMPNTFHAPVGKRGSIPNASGRAGRSNLVRGINRVTSRSFEDLLETGCSNSIPSHSQNSLHKKSSPCSPLTSIFELLADCPPHSWQKRYDASTEETYFVNPNNPRVS